MKKVLAICLTMLFVASMGATVCAAPAGFVSSPAAGTAPTMISFDLLSDDCTADLEVTSYGDRNTLPAAELALVEKAYADITTDLTGLVKEFAGKKDLAVSNLFDISAVGCANHEDHEGFTITLAVEALNRFEGLLHMTADGKWELVDAKIINSGKNLQFTVNSLSPFAVVINTGAGDSPATGDNAMMYVYATVMAVSALAVLTITVKGKKNA